MARYQSRVLVVVLMVMSLLAISCTPQSSSSQTTPAGASSQDAEYKIVWEDNGAMNSFNWNMMSDMRERIVAACGGRVDLELHPMDELVQRSEICRAVTEGALDMGTYGQPDDLGRMGNMAWLLCASGLPGSPNGLQWMQWIYNGGGLEIEREIMEPYSYLIGVRPFGSEVFCYSNKILDSAESFKGVKFRTTGMWAEILEDLGASVVQLSGGEVYQAMERGVVDAFELSTPAGNWPYGFHEIAKYMGMPGIQSPGAAHVVVMNHKKWNSLPPDIQQIFHDEVIAMGNLCYGAQLIADAEAMEKYRATSIEIFEVKDEFQRDICLRAREKMEALAGGDAEFAAVYAQQEEFFRTWTALTAFDASRHSMYTVS